MSTDNKGLPIKGYVNQSDNNVTSVNYNKVEEEKALRNLDYLASLPDTDKRWLAISRTHLEQAYMAMNRAVFKPTRIKLKVDNA